MKYLKAENTEAAVNSYFTGLGVRGLGYAKTPKKVVHHKKGVEPYAVKFFAYGEQRLQLKRDQYCNIPDSTTGYKWHDEPYFEYSYDGENWNTWEYTISHTGTSEFSSITFNEITFGTPEAFYVYVRGNNSSGLHIREDKAILEGYVSSAYCLHFSFATEVEVTMGGDLLSLIDKSTHPARLPRLAFGFVFYNIPQLIDISDLIIPDVSLSDSAYSKPYRGNNFRETFANCQNLTYAPKILQPTIIWYNCYYKMFANCTSLINAPELPAMAMNGFNCYSYMFSGCTSLTTAPELPATALTNACYLGMFSGCTSLTAAPELPAGYLLQSCYESMFAGCKNMTTGPSSIGSTATTSIPISACCYMFHDCQSLTTAPELPNNLSYILPYGYKNMFLRCISLTTVPSSIGNSATTMYSGACDSMFTSCTALTQAPELPSTDIQERCYTYMFANCTNLTTPPSVLPATTLAESCYSNMFSNCKSLEYSPLLPAETLVSRCYYDMFYYCDNLSEITCLATNISAWECCGYWVYEVPTSSYCSFYKNPNMNDWPTGSNGIPSGWNVYDYDDN